MTNHTRARLGNADIAEMNANYFNVFIMRKIYGNAFISRRAWHYDELKYYMIRIINHEFLSRPEMPSAVFATAFRNSRDLLSIFSHVSLVNPIVFFFPYWIASIAFLDNISFADSSTLNKKNSGGPPDSVSIFAGTHSRIDESSLCVRRHTDRLYKALLSYLMAWLFFYTLRTEIMA